MTDALHHLLSRAAARYPHQLAVIDGTRSFTYAQLDAWSDHVARRLQLSGIGRADRVGIYIDKSAEAVAGVYGALKAGACYVPLDSQAPADRLRRIARDCTISGLLTGPRRGLAGGRIDDLPDLRAVIALDGDSPATGDRGHSAAAPEVSVGAHDLAYILYTSGSTGWPKGVTLTHGNALSFVEWAATELELTPDDRMSGHAPLHFDLSIFDVFGAAAGAATLVLVPPRASVFAVELAEFIQRMRLTVWYSVPSALTLLLRQGCPAADSFPHLRLVLFAGEVFPTPYLRRLKTVVPDARLVNLYGPTETNVCTWHDVRALPASDDPIPIGGPITGVEAVAMSADGRPAGPGEIGELLVRGPTVMREYWNDPDRTAEVLIPSPPGSRWPFTYRTGDLVRVGEDGQYWFLGRRDHQVKTRGYRVELTEIESALYAHPAVAECAVVAVPDDVVTNRLVACVVTSEAVGAVQVARACREHLPRYMIPDRFEFFDELPKTSTGKVDRHALHARVIAASVD